MEPFYSRYSQKGKDANGRPIGRDVPQDDPNYDKTGRELGWKFIQAVPGTAPQVSEWNELQEIVNDKIRDLGDYVLRDGQTIGLQLTINKSAKTASIEWQDPSTPGKVYAFGQFHIVPPTILNETNNGFKAAGVETVAVRITKRIETEVQDVSLRDPIAGFANFGKPGAYRWVYDVTPVIKTDANRDQLTDTYDIWIIQDGDIRLSSNDQLTLVDRHLIEYTADISGDCKVRGMRVRVEDASATDLRVIVDRGRAYVGGQAVGYNTTTTKTIKKAKIDKLSVIGENLSLASSTVEDSGTDPALAVTYSFANGPIQQVAELVLPVVVRKRGVVGTNFKKSYLGGGVTQVSLLPDYTMPENGYGPLNRIVAVYLDDGNTMTAVNWEEVSNVGFKTSEAIDNKTIEVVWIYNALLARDTGAGGDFVISADGKTIELTFATNKPYPKALGNSATWTANDQASYVYPGLGQTTVTSVISADVLELQTTQGLQKGQKIYIGTALDTAEDVEATILDIISNRRIQLTSNLVNQNVVGQKVYGAPAVPFADLRLGSLDRGVVDYSWLLDRVDILYIDKYNNLEVHSGQSNKPAYPPSIPDGVLPLVKIELPANGNAKDVRIVDYSVQRLDQKDLQNLLRRIERSEYNQSIQELRLASYNKATASGLQLRGIFTDPAINSDGVDITNNAALLRDDKARVSIQLDPEHGWISPAFDVSQFNLQLDETNSTCYKGLQTFGLGHTLVGSAEVYNPVFTDEEIIRGATNTPKPTLSITTGHYTGLFSSTRLSNNQQLTFPFFNVNTQATENVPVDLEGGAWRVRQERLFWLENRPLYLPQLTLGVVARNLTASATYKFKVDGRLLSVTPTGQQLADGYSLTLADRTVSGHNSRTLELTNSAGVTLATTLFGSNVSETSFLPVVYDSLVANPYVPVAQLFSFIQDTYIRGVRIGFSTVDTSATAWVEVQIRNVDALGRPGNQIYARRRLKPADIALTGMTEIVFDGSSSNASGDPVLCRAGTSLALCLLASSSAFAVRKAVVGNRDSAGSTIASKPLEGLFYTSADGVAFTAQAQSTLTFQLLECRFDTAKKLAVFQPVDLTSLGKLPFALLRLQEQLPAGTQVSWSYSLDNLAATVAIQPDLDGTLDPRRISNTTNLQSITLRAELSGSTQVSPLVNRSSSRLLAFLPRYKGIYTTRQVQLAGVDSYGRARITFQLPIATDTDAVQIKFAPFGSQEGGASLTLEGTPIENDFFSISIDGRVFPGTAVAAGATDTLETYGDTWVASVNAEMTSTGFDCEIYDYGLVSGKYGLKLRRKSGRAYVSGDVANAAVVTTSTNDLLRVTNNAVLFDYKEVGADQLVSTTIIDDTFAEYVYDLVLSENEDVPPSNRPPGNPAAFERCFRLQLELTTRDVLNYPRVKNISVVVSAS